MSRAAFTRLCRQIHQSARIGGKGRNKTNLGNAMPSLSFIAQENICTKHCKSDELSKKSDDGRHKKVWVALTRCQVRMTFNPPGGEKFDAQLFCPNPALNYTEFLHKGTTQEPEFQMLIKRVTLWEQIFLTPNCFCPNPPPTLSATCVM